MGQGIRKTFGDRVILALVIALALAWLAPIVWVVGLSLKPNDVLMRSTGGLLAPPFTVKNYTDIAATSAVFGWMLNSTIVAVGQTVLTLALSTLAGYGFARTDFPGKKVVFVLVLAGLAVPEQAIIVPLHTMFAEANLHNTYFGLIAPRLAVPFGVFLMTQYFRAIPAEIEEAAMLDNASRLKIFFRIMLPLTIPAQATLGIYTFLHAWNEYFWPLVSATKPEMYTLTIGLAATQTNFAQTEGIGFLMAQAVFAGIPVLILYLERPMDVSVAVRGFEGLAVAEALQLHHPDLQASNTKDAPERVRPTPLDVAVDGTRIDLSLASASWAVVSLAPPNGSLSTRTRLGSC